MDDLLSRAAALARLSDSPENYTRTYLTPAHQAAARQLAAWMREAGMAVRVDAVGNVIGRYAARTEKRVSDTNFSGSPKKVVSDTRFFLPAKALLLGSHFDSVRNGGRYDGVLGILVAIDCVAQLHRSGERLAHAIEVAAFADEEGARFQTSFLSSRVLVEGADALAPLLGRRDAEGITLAEALRAAGLDPAAADNARIDPATLAAYVEVHIEQGPVLLQEGLPLGVVTAIASGSRHRARVLGEAGHAGTVPMAMRRDALAAAAEMALAVEDVARGHGVVGTVGLLRVKDGTGNVIPGEAEFTIDLRAPDDARRHRAWQSLRERLESIAARRHVALDLEQTHDVAAVPCAAWLQDLLADSVRRVGVRVHRLPSGAGHDAMILARICDVGMLFVRCGAGGVSHNPAETVTAEDARLAAEALLDFLRRFRARSSENRDTGNTEDHGGHGAHCK